MAKLSNILDAVALQKRLLGITGCWPYRSPSITYRLKYCISWAIDISFQFFLFSELYKNLLVGEYKAMTELLSFMSSEVPYLLKHLIFDAHRGRFMRAMEKLDAPQFTHYPQACDSYVQTTIRYARVFMRCYQFGVVNLVLLYFVKPFFSEQTAIRFSVFEMGAWRLPFHCYQVACIALACYNNSTLDLVALGIMSIASAQFEILRDKLRNARRWAGLTNEEIDAGVENHPEGDMQPELDRTVNAYLGECVKHHLGILEFAADIESVFTYYFLVQFMDSVMAICNTWFQFMLEDQIVKIMFLVFYTIVLLAQLGLYCVYGNTLMLRSEEVRDACYFSDWDKCDNKVRRSLFIIMERAKRPTVLTAGKFSILNLTTYVGLVKMSYSYFALMNRLYGN